MSSLLNFSKQKKKQSKKRTNPAETANSKNTFDIKASNQFLNLIAQNVLLNSAFVLISHTDDNELYG